MSVNNNADDYANARIGIFFQGFPNYLTGQCVSLVKWFLQEMANVADPQAARGHAKDYGDTLVRQGHAFVVSAGERRRGDVVVWKGDGGGYGHIGVLLSGDRVFEENVGIAGSTRGVYEGNVVYASRIDPLYASWRAGSPTFYRIRSYAEINPAPAQGGRNDMTPNFIRRAYYLIQARNPEQAEVDFHMAKSTPESFINGFGESATWIGLARERDALANERNNANAQRDAAIAERDAANSKAGQSDAAIQALNGKIAEYDAKVADLDAKLLEKNQEIEALKKAPVTPAQGGSTNLNDYSLGELLAASFQKLFKIK